MDYASRAFTVIEDDGEVKDSFLPNHFIRTFFDPKPKGLRLTRTLDVSEILRQGDCESDRADFTFKVTLKIICRSPQDHATLTLMFLSIEELVQFVETVGKNYDMISLAAVSFDCLDALLNNPDVCRAPFYKLVERADIRRDGIVCERDREKQGEREE